MLTFPPPPPDLDLHELAEQVGDFAADLLDDDEESEAAELGLAESLPVWTFDRKSRQFLDTGRWQHLIVDRGRSRFVAESKRESDGWNIVRLSESDTATAFDSAMQKLPELMPAGALSNYSAYMLDILPYQLSALWLRRLDDDPEQVKRSDDETGRVRPLAHDAIMVLACPKGFATLRPLRVMAAPRFVSCLLRQRLPGAISPTTEESPEEQMLRQIFKTDLELADPLDERPPRPKPEPQ